MADFKGLGDGRSINDLEFVKTNGKLSAICFSNSFEVHASHRPGTIMPNWKYIGLLTLFLCALIVHVFAGSEVKTLQVTGKHVKEGTGRRGLSTEHLVVETSDGDLRILKFPVLGYTFGANDAFKGVPDSGHIRARVALWPPAILTKHGKPHILRIYSDRGQPASDMVGLVNGTARDSNPNHLLPGEM